MRRVIRVWCQSWHSQHFWLCNGQFSLEAAVKAKQLHQFFRNHKMQMRAGGKRRAGGFARLFTSYLLFYMQRPERTGCIPVILEHFTGVNIAAGQTTKKRKPTVRRHLRLHSTSLQLKSWSPPDLLTPAMRKNYWLLFLISCGVSLHFLSHAETDTGTPSCSNTHSQTHTYLTQPAGIQRSVKCERCRAVKYRVKCAKKKKSKNILTFSAAQMSLEREESASVHSVEVEEAENSCMQLSTGRDLPILPQNPVRNHLLTPPLLVLSVPQLVLSVQFLLLLLLLRLFSGAGHIPPSLYRSLIHYPGLALKNSQIIFSVATWAL